MKRLLLIVVILFAIQSPAVIAQPEIEKLKSELQIANNELEKLQKLQELTIKLKLVDYKKSLEYATQALSLSEEIDYEKGLAISLRNIGYIYYKNDNKEALQYFKKSLKIFRMLDDRENIHKVLNYIGTLYYELGEYSKFEKYYSEALELEIDYKNKDLFIASIYANMGDIYRIKGEYEKSLRFSAYAIQTYKKYNMYFDMSVCQTNIALVYQNQGNYDKAKEFHYKALLIRQDLKLDRWTSRTLNNIGRLLSIQGYYNDAIKYYQHALRIQEDVNNQTDIAYFTNNIGEVYYHQGIYQKAIKYLEKSLSIKKNLDGENEISETLNFLAKSYFKINEYNTAISFANKSLLIAQEKNQLKSSKDACETMYDIYIASGDSKKAIEYKNKKTEIDESILRSELHQAFADINEGVDHNKTISNFYSLLKNVNTAIGWVIVFSILVVFAIIIIGYIAWVIKHENKKTRKAYIIALKKSIKNYRE